MSDELLQRAQDAVERFLEDESLTEDLTDEQAKPLINWLTQEARSIALDAALSNEEVSATLKRLRSAVKRSCKDIEGDLLADAILARVQHNSLPTVKASPEEEPSPPSPRATTQGPSASLPQMDTAIKSRCDGQGERSERHSGEGRSPSSPSSSELAGSQPSSRPKIPQEPEDLSSPSSSGKAKPRPGDPSGDLQMDPVVPPRGDGGDVYREEDKS